MPKKIISSISTDKLYLIVIFASLLAISFNLTIFAHNRLATRVLGAQTESSEEPLLELTEEKAFWEDIIEKHPSYRDAYRELADIESRLGNMKRTQEILNLARGIDPNY